MTYDADRCMHCKEDGVTMDVWMDGGSHTVYCSACRKVTYWSVRMSPQYPISRWNDERRAFIPVEVDVTAEQADEVADAHREGGVLVSDYTADRCARCNQDGVTLSAMRDGGSHRTYCERCHAWTWWRVRTKYGHPVSRWNDANRLYIPSEGDIEHYTRWRAENPAV